MDTFSGQRYETKIETFDTCMIETTNHERDTTQQVNGQGPAQTVQVDNPENHESNALQQQQQSPQQEQSNQISQMQSNSQQSMTLTPVRLPAILDGEFFTVVRVEDTNVTARCLLCQRLLNGSLRSTGNFLSHIKRVHPFMVEKLKCKSNQRKPAMIYIDLSADKCPEVLRSRKGYRKCFRTTDESQQGPEESFEQPTEWNESPQVRRRRVEEVESTDTLKISHNNSFVVEDEFDAIGRNVAAKLRNMRLDQRIIAEKLLNDILFEAQLGNLHRDSNIHV